MKPAGCVRPCHSILVDCRELSPHLSVTHKQWRPPPLPLVSSLCPHPWPGMCRSSQYPRRDVGCQMIMTTKKGKMGQRMSGIGKESGSFQTRGNIFILTTFFISLNFSFGTFFFPTISAPVCLFLSVTFLPSTFSLFPTSFSLSLCLCLLIPGL